jgi:hypothetical protein
MTLKIKQQNITLDPSVIAQAQGASGTSTTATSPVTAKANANSPIKNEYGFVVNGKTPSVITLSQLSSALADTTNNAPAIQKMATDVGSVPGALSDLQSISTNGNLTPVEQNYLKNYALGVVNSTPKGQAASIYSYVTGKLNPQQFSPYAINSTISDIQKDQPNIQASQNTINSVFMNLLGRSATQNEINAYTQQYLNYAAANPTQNTSGSVTYKVATIPTATGTTSNRLLRSGESETSTQNDLAEQQYLQNQVLNSGDYKAFQASGAAFNLLNQIASKDAGVA